MDLIKKYPPITFDDFWGSSDVVVTLKKLISNGGLPRTILFSGFCGVGKTSISEIVAGEISKLQEVDYQDSFNTYHYSSPKEFTRYICSVSSFKGTKVFILNEADTMSKTVQGSLLGPMDYTVDKYFILTSTDEDKLIPAIHSRSHQFRIRRLGKEVSTDYIRHIAGKEALELPQSEVDKIAVMSKGVPREILKNIEYWRKKND